MVCKKETLLLWVNSLIIEEKYLKLKEAHKDHGAQTLNPHSTTQNSSHISERVVQPLFELCPAWCCKDAVGHPMVSGLNKPGDLSCSHAVFPSRSFTSSGCCLIAFCLSDVVAPTLHPVQEVRPHSRLGQPLSSAGGSAGHGAPQGAVGPLGCQGTLLAQIQLYQCLQTPDRRAQRQSQALCSGTQ